MSIGQLGRAAPLPWRGAAKRADSVRVRAGACGESGERGAGSAARRKGETSGAYTDGAGAGTGGGGDGRRNRVVVVCGEDVAVLT